MKEESENVGLKLNIQKAKIMASGPITSWEIDGETVSDIFGGSPKLLQMVTAAMKLKDTCFWKKSYDQSRQNIKKQRHYFANKDLSSQSYGFSSSHVWMWELDVRRLNAEKLMLLNCGAGEDSSESLGLQGDPSCLSYRKSILNIHWKDWCWSSNNLATWCKELTHWKRPWC